VSIVSTMRRSREIPDADDQQLVDMARIGDRDAFGALVERHQRRVWLVCRQYVGADEADAAAQDAWLKAWTALATFDGRAAFTTWLTRISINVCLDQIRRRRRQGVRVATGADPDGDGLPVSDLMVDDGPGPEARSMQRQAVERLRRYERELPDRQREIFRLRFYAELELDQIAEALGVHVGTVKTQLHRAVHRLRRELGDVR
jgi:RNA polymerase sigma-70 factor (ECF subfamily)